MVCNCMDWQKDENEIKALKYDLEQSKDNFKDKLNCILAKNT